MQVWPWQFCTNFWIRLNTKGYAWCLMFVPWGSASTACPKKRARTCASSELARVESNSIVSTIENVDVQQEGRARAKQHLKLDWKMIDWRERECMMKAAWARHHRVVGFEMRAWGGSGRRFSSLSSSIRHYFACRSASAYHGRVPQYLPRYRRRGIAEGSCSHGCLCAESGTTYGGSRFTSIATSIATCH